MVHSRGPTKRRPEKNGRNLERLSKNSAERILFRQSVLRVGKPAFFFRVRICRNPKFISYKSAIVYDSV
jgi:hypothetical protein